MPGLIFTGLWAPIPFSIQIISDGENGRRMAIVSRLPLNTTRRLCNNNKTYAMDMLIYHHHHDQRQGENQRGVQTLTAMGGHIIY